MAFKVGLTGGIASGKSTVANLFSDLGIQIIDTDLIARQIVAPGAECYQAVIDLFGKACLQTDATLDRAYLRHRIFDDPLLKKQLEDRLHPVIRRTSHEQSEIAVSPYVMIMVPLLFEAGFDREVDRTLTVDVSENIQLTRLLKRDHITLDLAEKMIKSQLSRQQRLQLSDDIVDNSVSVDKLSEQVARLHDFYLNLVTK